MISMALLKRSIYLNTYFEFQFDCFGFLTELDLLVAMQ